MNSTPTFEQHDASASGRLHDVLDDVEETDRQINKLMAVRARQIAAAHVEYLAKFGPGKPDEFVGEDLGKRVVRFQDHVMVDRSFRAELAAVLSISERAATTLIGNSEALIQHLPLTMDALERGDISWYHARVMVEETSDSSIEETEIIEPRLMNGTRRTASRLRTMARNVRDRLYPNQIGERHEKAKLTREVGIDDLRDGMSMTWQILPSVHAHALFNRWTKAATAMDGPLEERTLDQRRADLFMHVNLAEIDGVPGGLVPDEHDDEAFVRWFRGIHAEVFLEVPVMTLLGKSDVPATLDGVVPIDPVTARILVSEAPGLTRVLTHPETGVVLSIGRERYPVPKPLRNWLRLRDRKCRFPGCNIPAHRCDIDHGVEWHDGGETNANNLGHLCPGHHTLKGNTTWQVIHAQDGSGVVTWITPTGRTYTEQPYRPFAAA